MRRPEPRESAVDGGHRRVLPADPSSSPFDAVRSDPTAGDPRRRGHGSARLAEAGLAPRFDDQALAEQWLTAFYPELVELGVDAVVLMEEDRVIYGPMALSPQ